MISLSQIESDLTAAMKNRRQMEVETLRGLKTRIQNEKIAKQKELSEADLIVLIRSEVKRRKEAAAVYVTGGRAELAEKEQQEAAILEKYLPAQISEADLGAEVDKFLAQNNFTAKDFGAAMGKLKAKLGDSADGATIARFLKEKLK
jgi:hypothetical protein